MNKRVFYAVKQVGMAPLGSQTFTEIHGLQSVGLNTTFNLEQVFEIGQLAVYENIENIPEVEMTLEKVLDGYPLMWHLATRGANAGTLVGRSNSQTIAAMTIHDDTGSAASGDPIAQVQCSGMFAQSLSYNFVVDGNFTEQLTLVGSHKEWDTAAPYVFTGAFDNTDTPLALASGLGGVQRRENLSFTYSASDLDANGSINEAAPTGGTYALLGTVLPQDIAGISSSGTNDTLSGLDEYSCSVQSISASTDLGRTELFELGRKLAYHRYVEFPVEVTCEIEIMAKTGDLVTATENTSLSARTIKIATEDGTFIDLGTQNKLSNITFGGGDATGGNDTITYTYATSNDFTVFHPLDPSVL